MSAENVLPRRALVWTALIFSGLTLLVSWWHWWTFQYGTFDLAFDLAHDPDELEDLSARPEQATRVAELRAKLLSWLNEKGDPFFDAVAAARL